MMGRFHRALSLPFPVAIMLIFLFSFPFAVADIDVLYAQDWTSSQTITSETSAYGAFDDATATFNNFAGTGDDATASLINDTVGSGTLNGLSFEIRMDSAQLDDDSLNIQYWDSGTTTWYTVATGIQPTALTTYGPYTMPQVTTFAEINATQVRIVWVKSKSGDKAEILMDGVEITVNYTAADTTLPTISLNSPGNDTWDLDGDLTLVYTPNDDVALENCSLFFDGSFNQTNTSPLDAGGQNNFTLTGVADGTHTWYINCSDTSTNWNVSETRYVKIDTIAPVVNLEIPDQDNVSSVNDIDFFYNVTDAQTNISSCTLYVNGTEKDSTTNPVESTSLNFSITLTNALWTWWVNCTDGNGFTTMSEQRNITVNGSVPTIAPSTSTYVLGETAMISGENFNPSVQVTINYTLPNTTVISVTNTTTASGTFNAYLFLDYDFPNGTYSVFAYQTNDLTENSSTTFDVVLPSTSLTIVPDPVIQGNQINITGGNYSPSSSVNITLFFSDGSNVSFVTPSDASGDISYNYNLSYVVADGVTNATAFDTNYTQINATDQFTIDNRTAALLFTPATYGRDTNINFYGYNFTRLGTIEFHLYDNTTDDSTTGYPKNKTADDDGYFTEQWNTGSTCNGVYRVEAWDQNNSFYNDTKYFTISELIQNEDLVLLTAGAKYHTTLLSVTNSNVNVSDGTNETLTSNSKTQWYYEFNFTNSYNHGLAIDAVIFRIEHVNDGSYTAPTVQYWNGSSYEAVACPDFGPGATGHADECDLSSTFSTAASLDQVSLRLLMTKTSGGSSTWAVDYIHLNISTSYEPSCVYFNGSSGGGLAENPPFVLAVLVDDDVPSPPDEVDLTPGSTNLITCNVSVSDNDGYTDIDTVNATFFNDIVNSSDPDNSTNHYTNTSCTLANGVGNDANYTCTFPVWYYALNGTWICEATAADSSDFSVGEDNTTMNNLYALNVTPVLLDYGNVSEGQNSSEIQANVSNIGNVNLNLSLRGYGATDGDGLSFTCPQENLSIDLERYALSSGGYGAKTPLTSTFADASLTINSTGDGTPSWNLTYWQVQIPTTGDPYGVCNGTIVFQADATG